MDGNEGERTAAATAAAAMHRDRRRRHRCCCCCLLLLLLSRGGLIAVHVDRVVVRWRETDETRTPWQRRCDA